MFQLLEFDNPIPSCQIHGLKRNGDKWVYQYAVNTPVEITDDNQIDLIVYEYISDLMIKIGEGQHPDAVNIHFKTLSEYLSLLETQRMCDIAFRKKWLDEHPNAEIKKFNRRTLENKDWNFNELKDENVHFISFLINDDGEHSEFASV